MMEVSLGVFSRIFPLLKKIGWYDIGIILVIVYSLFNMNKRFNVLVFDYGNIYVLLFGILIMFIGKTRDYSFIDLKYNLSSEDNTYPSSISFLHIEDIRMLTCSQIELDVTIQNKFPWKNNIFKVLKKLFDFHIGIHHYSDQLDITPAFDSIDLSEDGKIKGYQKVLVTEHMQKETFNCGVTICLKNYDEKKRTSFRLELNPIKKSKLFSCIGGIMSKTFFHAQKELFIYN